MIDFLKSGSCKIKLNPLKIICPSSDEIMLLILAVNSEKAAHMLSEIGKLICLSQFFEKHFYKIPVFFHTCATCSEIPSNRSTMEEIKNKGTEMHGFIL